MERVILSHKEMENIAEILYLLLRLDIISTDYYIDLIDELTIRSILLENISS